MLLMDPYLPLQFTPVLAVGSVPMRCGAAVGFLGCDGNLGSILLKESFAVLRFLGRYPTQQPGTLPCPALSAHHWGWVPWFPPTLRLGSAAK